MAMEAGSCDVSDIKQILVDGKVIAFTPALDIKKKSEWGARHPATLKLILSIEEDPADIEVQKEYQLPGARLPTKSLPCFLWRNGEFNKQDPYSGAFEGEILVAAVRKLISGRHKSFNASGKIAEHVFNVRALAYCAMIARFCLSSTVRADDEPIKPPDFYAYIVGWLTDQSRVEFLEVLLKWYKTEVINSADEDSNSDSEHAATTSPFDNIKYVPRSARPSTTGQLTIQAEPETRSSSTLASSTIASLSFPRRSPGATGSTTPSIPQADQLPATTQDRNVNETGNQTHAVDGAHGRQLNNTPPQATSSPSRDTSSLSPPPNSQRARQAITATRLTHTRRGRRVESDFESEERDNNVEGTQGDNRDDDDDEDEDEPVAKRGRKSKTSETSRRNKKV
ncbi:hypothetical protein SISSUDRAFT_1067449 [Sistotremastrum suecicum HHB10207 ss-3]|uniref:Uncharacterized protein n=1 Tax=Sistotremastrum suecicum HHB10207 ss-3 TaxID=1314776 RepID=A0A165X426_9AGAM|nr:hypothetical protein SISSUDRAFT_1067449 [Sistotremastrum suecicum HHB10207 ss-3]